MAKAPTPGTTTDEPTAAKFILSDGTEVLCDQKTLTMAERRLAKQELKRLEDPDDMEALVAFLWVVMRRDDPSVDFLELMDRVTVSTLQDAEVGDATPEADDPSR